MSFIKMISFFNINIYNFVIIIEPHSMQQSPKNQVLNLTGSLIQEVNPVDTLEYINFIENLTVLELGENQVRVKI